MATALIVAGTGVALLILIIVTVLLLCGRRVRRGRKLGRYQYRAKPNGTHDSSSTTSPH
ncbi:hypothetical protein OG413_28905 [Streptomyces sp. NBC_01433]|uniref:hypothetical protein n=1 Tax=Streptomyces sp. NBC_01433 TaxID=2903864 RepID=UPI00224E3B05|nr:hypothetical protein [Streptomyces sp. NBC_01433]MCX4679268.1 hypothetical protein [Streptomyces sp. NBC_01433]